MFNLNRAIEFVQSQYEYDSAIFASTPMSDFDDSFNIIIGTKNEELDWFDNPYISPQVYQSNHLGEIRLSNDIRLKKCTRED